MFEGENSFGALYALLGAIISQMPMPASPDSPDMSAETLAAAVAFFGETGLADIYANAMCQAPSEEVDCPTAHPDTPPGPPEQQLAKKDCLIQGPTVFDRRF